MLTERTWLGNILLLLYVLLAVAAIGSSAARGDERANGSTSGNQRSTQENDSNLPDEQYSPKTKAELRKILTRIQYRVTQEEDTEPAFRNAYWDNKKAGTYFCICCNKPLFNSETKFESGTGWPSFWQPVADDAVGTKIDFKLQYPRTEVHCSRCKAHLGHVFNDGPAPTGLRFCMNSASLKFLDQQQLKAIESARQDANKQEQAESTKPGEGGVLNTDKPKK